MCESAKSQLDVCANHFALTEMLLAPIRNEIRMALS